MVGGSSAVAGTIQPANARERRAGLPIICYPTA
jgi:hypothetical protein